MKENREASVLVAIAAGWGLVLFFLAIVLPIVTQQGTAAVSSPTSSSPATGIIAWIFAGIVLTSGVIGFTTILFLVGLAIVPIGVLLLMACNRVALQQSLMAR